MESVFRLNGVDENSATYALGWVLEKSPHFRCAMLRAWFDQDINQRSHHFFAATWRRAARWLRSTIRPSLTSPLS